MPLASASLPVEERQRLGLRDAGAVQHFRGRHLGGRRMTLITLHHSLYYSPQTFWKDLLADLHEHLLATTTTTTTATDPSPGPSAAIHAVLMASASEDPTS